MDPVLETLLISELMRLIFGLFCFLLKVLGFGSLLKSL